MAIKNTLLHFLKRIGRLFKFLRNVAANLLLLLFFGILLSILFLAPTPPEIQSGTALLLKPTGALVEERADFGGLSSLLSSPMQGQTIVADVIKAIKKSSEDDRITALVIDPTTLTGASSAHLDQIGKAITHFKKSGKPVIALGNYFSQGQYLLASYADDIYMHPFGEMILSGLSSKQPYFHDLFTKLQINIHVFRVGTHKAAVEPFVRSNMSEEAKEDNRAVIGQLWDTTLQSIARNRQLTEEHIRKYSEEYDQLLLASNGDAARVAMEQGLITELLTYEEIDKRVQEHTNVDENHYRRIGIQNYLQGIAIEESPFPSEKDQIGVIVASGNILMGTQPRGSIGAVSIAELIREARNDEQIKAIVLRIDSPGGSALASELIRQELELVQTIGKPVIVSMAGTAASGGYWIAATADEIWAAPTTITGSIGVFGILPTFEKSLTAVGVNYDGVETGPLSSGVSPFEDINETTARVLQSTVEFTYRTFVDLVARGRNMDPDNVDRIAQGRIWTGLNALENGLVDQLGHLDDAIKSAASIAGINDNFDVKTIEKSLSPQELFLQEITNNFALKFIESETQEKLLTSRFMELPAIRDISNFLLSNDPKRVYAICTGCNPTNTLN